MNFYTREHLIEFEASIKHLWEIGELPSLVHLSGGNEGQLIEIFKRIRHRDWVFVSHRNHYHCLLKGMQPERLRSNILNDRSMFPFDRELRIYSSAILAGTCGIATGVARAIKDAGRDEMVYVFLGDGAADNGHLHEAALYATGHDLPILFVLENNNKQVDTDIATRRGPNHERYIQKSPKIMEYTYTPSWPHAGSGCQHQITFKRTTPL